MNEKRKHSYESVDRGKDANEFFRRYVWDAYVDYRDSREAR